mgnify:CR=1 FL=1
MKNKSTTLLGLITFFFSIILSSIINYTNSNWITNINLKPSNKMLGFFYYIISKLI